ncbi:hypothetical protein F511_30939 [Dorcoceras hygrometricum]|uniref:Uncharacterized protein n=1 Tax=Dorcoceras hygrometricum TaxID=472368 RepID=A0A2Z7B2Z3_9LAMI|nr:hypothetical protein F511_30939 [Dorcoceras hygrometricum]
MQLRLFTADLIFFFFFSYDPDIFALRSYFVRISSVHQISSALCSDLYCTSYLSSALSSDLFSCSRMPSAVGHIWLQLLVLLPSVVPAVGHVYAPSNRSHLLQLISVSANCSYLLPADCSHLLPADCSYLLISSTALRHSFSPHLIQLFAHICYSSSFNTIPAVGSYFSQLNFSFIITAVSSHLYSSSPTSPTQLCNQTSVSALLSSCLVQLGFRLITISWLSFERLHC